MSNVSKKRERCHFRLGMPYLHSRRASKRCAYTPKENRYRRIYE